MFDKETIPEGASVVIDRLKANGFEAFLVGGCVRDMLMNRIPNDWDICTDAYPEVVQAMFEGTYTVIPTGIQHGTVTIMVHGEGYEVTTYRIDGDYSDGRRPDAVSYSKSLKEDLSRRDFTMNALAYNSELGIVDYFGGKEDIERGLIRCVGKAENRFTEDSLRILRAVRFAATTGFCIDTKTDKAIRTMLPSLGVLSAERVLTEVSKLICGDYAFKVLMSYPDVITHIIPELQPTIGCKQHNPHHIYDVWEHTCRAVSHAPNSEVIRFATLFHDIGKPDTKVTVEDVDHFYGHAKRSVELAEVVLRRLKSSNELIDKVTTLIQYHDSELPSKTSVKRLLNKIGVEGLTQLLQLKEADTLAQATYTQDSKLDAVSYVEEVLSDILEEQSCFKLKDLAITGRDLIEVGFQPGKEIGRVLSSLLNDVIEEELPNEKDILLLKAMLLRAD